MEFPNLLALPDDQVQLVLQGYVAGLTDQKQSIIDLISDVIEDTEDLVVKAALKELANLLMEETTLGDLLSGE